MFGWFSKRFATRPVLVRGTGALPEGEALKCEVGDVHAGGTQIVVCRVGGKLYALDAACPHDGGRIMGGALVDGKFALCPLHNYLFEPKTGKPVRGACPNATTYKVRERDADCEVWVRSP